MDAVDTKDLGKAATEGVEDIGHAAKNKAIQWINQRGEKEPKEKERGQ